jgi:hypothetical protein
MLTIMGGSGPAKWRFAFHPHADFFFLSERKAPLSVDGAQKLIERPREEIRTASTANLVPAF